MPEQKTTPTSTSWFLWLLASILGAMAGLVIGWLVGSIVGGTIGWLMGSIVTVVGVAVLSVGGAMIGAVIGVIIGLRLAWPLCPKSRQPSETTP
jgi:hypothetical protein